jgi:aryl-alcohol dehydrogenase-like predicted oxidoreductase
VVEVRPLGATGIGVSAVGLGAWQLGRSAAWPDGPDQAEAVRIVHAAIDAGVTFLDTAPGYADGQSELNIGRALAGRRRDEVVLCTKFGHTPEGGTDWSSAAVEAAVERSARRLGTDRLDVVLLHNPPPEVLDGSRSDHYEVLQHLVDRGLVRAYGASVDRAADVDTVLATSRSTALEVRLSALYQEPWEAVERAGAAGVGTIVKVPLESGWLSGRYHAGTAFTGVRSRWTREDVALRAALVEELRALLPPGTSLLQGALRLLLAHDGVSTVIPGTRSVEQLRSTVAAVAEPLPPATVAAVREWYAARLGSSPLDW